MIVCVCHNVSDSALTDAVRSGADSLAKVQRIYPIGRSCGQCAQEARRIISQHNGSCQAHTDQYRGDVVQVAFV